MLGGSSIYVGVTLPELLLLLRSSLQFEPEFTWRIASHSWVEAWLSCWIHTIIAYHTSLVHGGPSCCTRSCLSIYITLMFILLTVFCSILSSWGISCTLVWTLWSLCRCTCRSSLSTFVRSRSWYCLACWFHVVVISYKAWVVHDFDWTVSKWIEHILLLAIRLPIIISKSFMLHEVRMRTCIIHWTCIFNYKAILGWTLLGGSCTRCVLSRSRCSLGSWAGSLLSGGHSCRCIPLNT